MPAGLVLQKVPEVSPVKPEKAGNDERVKPAGLGFAGSGEEAAALTKEGIPPSYIAVITDAALSNEKGA